MPAPFCLDDDCQDIQGSPAGVTDRKRSRGCRCSRSARRLSPPDLDLPVHHHARRPGPLGGGASRSWTARSSPSAGTVSSRRDSSTGRQPPGCLPGASSSCRSDATAHPAARSHSAPAPLRGLSEPKDLGGRGREPGLERALARAGWSAYLSQSRCCSSPTHHSRARTASNDPRSLSAFRRLSRNHLTWYAGSRPTRLLRQRRDRPCAGTGAQSTRTALRHGARIVQRVALLAGASQPPPRRPPGGSPRRPRSQTRPPPTPRWARAAAATQRQSRRARVDQRRWGAEAEPGSANT